MKRMMLTLMPLLAVLCLCSCRQDKPEAQKPVNFYYTVNTEDFGEYRSVFQPEKRESLGYEQDWLGLLQQYLAGPADITLANPFPAHLVLEAIEVSGDICIITVSNEMAALSELDLTIACACLTLTATELTDTQKLTVDISALNGEAHRSITMSRAALLLQDID